jgi:uncharacterized protein
MKILAFGDLHGDTRLAERLAEKADREKVDLVIICGDITQADTETANLMGPFVKRHKKVLLVPGNHESVATADFLAEFYGLKNIHGYSVRYGDVGIFGAGGANIGATGLSEKELYDLLRKGFENIKYLKKTIMVTHVHPSKTKMEQFTRLFPGSDGVRMAIEKFQPDIMLCSHVHEAEGLEEKIGRTAVLNVGKEGKIIEV